MLAADVPYDMVHVLQYRAMIYNISYCTAYIEWQVAFADGVLAADVPSGSYSCIVLLPSFYAYFQKSCVVQPAVRSQCGLHRWNFFRIIIIIIIIYNDNTAEG